MSSCQLVTFALGEYAEPAWNVPQASECRRAVAELLQLHGAQVEDWTPKATRTDINPALEEWVARVEHPQVLYWVGHGEHSDDGYRGSDSWS